VGANADDSPSHPQGAGATAGHKYQLNVDSNCDEANRSGKNLFASLALADQLRKLEGTMGFAAAERLNGTGKPT